MRFNVLQFVLPESKRYANLPDSFIKRKMEQIYYKTPPHPNYLPKVHQRKKFYFELARPWTDTFRFQNQDKSDHVHVEPIKYWSFFRGDRVQILIGPDKGKQGIVKSIIQERNWITVNGLNTKLQLLKKTDKFPGIPFVFEMPLLVTEDVLLVDPFDLKPTKIEWRYTEDGEHVRVSVRTGRIIPIPPSHFSTADYKNPALYVEGDKDTTKEEVEKITFKPALKTFAMDIMDKMNIKEDRYQKPTYWY
ncbi:PREDICTED: probable 39S ribosomal protein L24, mitochondrial [Ceratosolen solmsi marchali]|uniref:Large ribosomal subunit protein uL24m n=1 Tax=Ceratosolen solmsi marchali TaxID=326594 RepID=A0AAJ6VJE6_9HYME|nr:PREDICTED: probable 39S ribosomal protein L24, mitochondrial [Ceratosolen solmsi marchali]